MITPSLLRNQRVGTRAPECSVQLNRRQKLNTFIIIIVVVVEIMRLHNLVQPSGHMDHFVHYIILLQTTSIISRSQLTNKSDD